MQTLAADAATSCFVLGAGSRWRQVFLADLKLSKNLTLFLA